MCVNIRRLVTFLRCYRGCRADFEKYPRKQSRKVREFRIQGVFRVQGFGMLSIPLASCTLPKHRVFLST